MRIVLATCLLSLAMPASAQIVRVGDLNTTQIRALDRLRRDEEDDDTDIALLAASGDPSEALTFAELLIERYSGYQALDPQLAAGKYLVALRHDYLRGIERRGRLGVLYSNKDYGCEWDYDWRNKRFRSEDNTRFAVNLVVYTMT